MTDRKFNVYLEVLIGCKNGAYTWDRNLVSFCKVKYKLRFIAKVFSIHNIESAFSNERFLICHSSTGNKFFIFVFFIMQRGVLL